MQKRRGKGCISASQSYSPKMRLHQLPSCFWSGESRLFNELKKYPIIVEKGRVFGNVKLRFRRNWSSAANQMREAPIACSHWDISDWKTSEESYSFSSPSGVSTDSEDEGNNNRGSTIRSPNGESIDGGGLVGLLSCWGRVLRFRWWSWWGTQRQ